MELLIILVVALVVLGPERLPEVARGAGRLIHKLKTLTENLQEEMKDVVDDPSMGPIKEISEFAVRPREKLAEYAAEAEAEARQAAMEKEAAQRATIDGAGADGDTKESEPIVELPDDYVADPATFEAPAIHAGTANDSDGIDEPSHGFYDPSAHIDVAPESSSSTESDTETE